MYVDIAIGWTRNNSKTTITIKRTKRCISALSNIQLIFSVHFKSSFFIDTDGIYSIICFYFIITSVHCLHLVNSLKLHLFHLFFLLRLLLRLFLSLYVIYILFLLCFLE